MARGLSFCGVAWGVTGAVVAIAGAMLWSGRVGVDETECSEGLGNFRAASGVLVGGRALRFNGGGETDLAADARPGFVGADAGSEESFRRFRGPSSSRFSSTAGTLGGFLSQLCCHWHPGFVQLSPCGQGIVLKFRKTASIVGGGCIGCAPSARVGYAKKSVASRR